MNKQTLRINAIAAIAAAAIVAGGSAAGLVIVTGGNAPQHAHHPVITVQPEDQLVAVGMDATFSATTGDGWSYQWLHNEVAIDGQTNSALTIENVQIEDAGNYSCFVDTGAETVQSSMASLLVYIIVAPDPVIVVYAQPIVSGGGSGTCPGPYAGYVNYTLTPAQGWGWVPSTNTTVYTATDTNRTNTKVQYGGDYGDNGCNKTSVTIPYPAFSPVYRFSIYFTNNVPTTNYPITLSGFNP